MTKGKRGKWEGWIGRIYRKGRTPLEDEKEQDVKKSRPIAGASASMNREIPDENIAVFHHGFLLLPRRLIPTRRETSRVLALIAAMV